MSFSPDGTLLAGGGTKYQEGAGDGLADLAARTGWAVYRHAVQAWIDDPAQHLDTHLHQAFNDLRALSSAASTLILPAVRAGGGIRRSVTGATPSRATAR